ncbi:uncharacterized protein L201_002459 [Kwoniella dendrophila CBS 6074]|uniref:Uncharacterized protein n=1 Tax=Kwoniella dendrophila CBS 6074 TaxID=1295534 RepID=A0AAX4JQB6_9TREE
MYSTSGVSGQQHHAHSSSSIYAPTQNLVASPYPVSHHGSSNDLKRRKLSPDSHQVSSSSTPTSSSTSSPSTVSTPALLYHFAVSAHHASHRHLQQAFVHPSISTDPGQGMLLAPLYSLSQSQPFVHDSEAAAKALGLQLMALDFLRAGLAYPNLSEKERVAFGLEFGIIGLKVYMSCKEDVKGKGKKTDKNRNVDTARLIGDMQEIVGQSYFISQKQTSFLQMRLQLELLNIRLAFLQSKGNLGKRMVQHALANNRDQASHRYALYLLHLEFLEMSGSMDFIIVANELKNEAQAKNHLHMIQLAALTTTRFVFISRRWELVAQSLADLSSTIGLSDDLTQPIPPIGDGLDRTWRASALIHCLSFRALWEGRVGNDGNAKVWLRHIYTLMDATSEAGVFIQIRANGGVILLDIPGYTPLQVQVTPPNILYMLTYLTTVVSRRDFTGSNATCKNILHSNALRQFEHVVRADDMWDTGFSEIHGSIQSQAQQKEILAIIGEMMIERVTALLFRSDLEGGYQHATLVGIDPLAERYYNACLSLINEESEFGLIAKIGLMGSKRELNQLLEDPIRREKVIDLAERCKGSTSAMFIGAGHLLASLTDENVVNSKKQLSTAYEISVKSNNNILRLLIFAFTTSTHHYGGRDRMYRQLETGKELAKLMGGRDRQDGVGQVVLGIWFAYRLKEYFRQEGDQVRAAQARETIKLHMNRLDEIKKQGSALSTAILGK